MIIGTAQTCSPFIWVVDTVSTITAPIAVALRDHPLTPVRAVARYLGSLTAAERDVIHGEGLAIVLVTFSKAPGWSPSASDGTSEGQRDVLALQALGAPQGVTVFTDLEGVNPALAAQSTLDWANARAAVQRVGGYDPGLYVGAEQPLNGSQLDQLVVDRYWQGLSRLTAPGAPLGFVLEPLGGWNMRQLPHTTTMAGIPVDVNATSYDFRGRLLTYWAA
jgi:Domain of unknown function (DUF1906)